jgi:hypothetical protein
LVKINEKKFAVEKCLGKVEGTGQNYLKNDELET